MLVGALKFEAEVDKERSKLCHNVQLNVVALPLQVLHEFHQGITMEMQEREKCMTVVKEKEDSKKETM